MPRTPASSTGSICSCVNSIDSSPWGEMDSAKNVQHNCSHRRPHLVVPSSSSISSSTDSVTATGRPGNSFTECTTKPHGSKSSKSDSKPDSGAQALASFGFYATELDRAQVTGTPFPHSEGLRQVVPVARLTIVPANPHATTMAEWMDGAPPKSHAHLHVSGDAAPHWFSRIKEDGSTVPMLKGEMEWEECDAETLGRAESKSMKSARSSIRTCDERVDEYSEERFSRILRLLRPRFEPHPPGRGFG
ncbi:hypothetical protein BKA62DRAFT_671313 [Auriculariales sp. MPI-PUGE-AT-0066]|nr:hypothetical protein BKA62DRAFT_671313 [Auriculariales sp. MPI-PUGE-AT-0066]